MWDALNQLVADPPLLVAAVSASPPIASFNFHRAYQK
jgi:hypothetical protein